MQYEVIDFHTHPFQNSQQNICQYQDGSGMSTQKTIEYLQSLGISRICGSVLCYNTDTFHYGSQWDCISQSNRNALELAEYYDGFYIPGFHVHPDYVQKSCEEIERMSKLGVKLIGELVPYLHGWQNYSSKAMDEIFDTAAQYQMVVSIHTEEDDDMDAMVRKHPNTVFVAAHPNGKPTFLRHLERMRMSENYYLDLSGSGIFRHRMIRYGIDQCGAHRFLFGSDYPTCAPAMFMGAVVLDTNLTEKEKVMILSGNAKRLLGL